MTLPTVLARTCLAALLFSAPLLAQGRVDVLNSKGQVQPLSNAFIERETLDEVAFRRGSPEGRLETRRAELVVRVVHGRGSPTWESARSAREAGELIEAATLFTAAAGEDSPPWQAPLALLELAETHAARGEAGRDEALAAVDRFLGEHAEHRELPRALLLKASLAAAAGDSAAMEGAVEQVLDLEGAGRIGPDWGVRAQLTLGNARLDAGDGRGAGDAFAQGGRLAQQALDELDGRADLRATLETLSLAARGGEGAALLADGQVAQARSFFQQLQRDGADDPAVAAAAGNGLALADFAEGQHKQAQLGFARVAVTGAAVPDEHAKALYYLGQCAEALADAGLEKGGRQKARTYYQEVQERYPASHWGRLARQALP